METLGVSVRTIRHREEVGLVMPSGRSPGGFRLYTDDAELLCLVKHMTRTDGTLLALFETPYRLERLQMEHPERTLEVIVVQ